MEREWKKKNYFEFDAIPAEVVATGEHIQGKLANGNFLAVSANEKTGVITFKEYPLSDITFCKETKIINKIKDTICFYCDTQNIDTNEFRDVFEWLDVKEKENNKFSKYPKASDIVDVKTDANSAVIITKNDVQKDDTYTAKNNEGLNSSTTTNPNKYGTITPTDIISPCGSYQDGYNNGWTDCLEQAKYNERDFMYNKGFHDGEKQAEDKMKEHLNDEKDWIYNKGFQDGISYAEGKIQERLEEEWAKGNDAGYEDGKVDMLMQVPHWKKVNDNSSAFGITRGCMNGNIYCDGWYVTLKELEKKLPRDEGTIYCDSVHNDYANEEGLEEDNEKYVETYRVLKEFRGERAYEIKVEKALDFVIDLLKEKIE